MRQQHHIKLPDNISKLNFGELNQKTLREYRMARLENQTRFWARFGVTQSRGSRFELGMEIPPPVSILLKLYINGIINDEDLQAVQKKASPKTRASQPHFTMDKSYRGEWP